MNSEVRRNTGPFASVNAKYGSEKGEGEKYYGEDCKDHYGARLFRCALGLFAGEVDLKDVGLFLFHV